MPLLYVSRKGETAWLLPAKAEREGKKKRIRTIETREAWAKGGGVYSFLRGDLLGGGLKAA